MLPGTRSDFDERDYELLLQLDSPKVTPVEKEVLASLPVRKLKDSDMTAEGPSTCCICLCEMVAGEQVRTLPCTHFYHVSVRVCARVRDGVRMSDD